MKKEQAIKRFLRKVDKTNSCWNWTGTKSRGYGYISIFNRMVLAHRFSYEFYRDTIPEGLEVCHTCDNPACVNPKHLWIGTHTDNMRDMSNKNKFNGENSSKAKLTNNDVKKIRELYSPYKHTRKQLAKKFGIAPRTISQIISYETWKYVK